MNNYRKITLFLAFSGIISSCNLEKIEAGGPSNACPESMFTVTTGGSSFEYPNDIVATADCGFVACGITNSFGANYDGYLVKINDQGVQQWERNFGSPEYDIITKIASTKDGGYIIGGATSAYSPGNYYDAYIIKTDASGIESWQRSYNEPGFSRITQSVMPLSDGSYLIVSSQSDTLGTIPAQIALIKTDANGSETWTKLISSSKALYVNDARVTSDGGFILAGSASGNNASDTYLLRLDPSGNKVWERFYSNPVSTYSPGYSVVPTSTGYAVAASILNNNDHDFNILFYDLAGNLKWEKSIGGASSDEALDISTTADGHLVTVGYSGSFSTNSEVYMLKLSINDGATVWEKHFGNRGGGNIALASALDGGFAVLANNNVTGNSDFVFYKTDSNGNF